MTYQISLATDEVTDVATQTDEVLAQSKHPKASQVRSDSIFMGSPTYPRRNY